MKIILLLLVSSVVQAGIGVHSDTTMSQQGVGFRASVTVTNSCITNDPRPLCITGARSQLFRDQRGTQNLSNPFQSMDNGRFLFFAQAGWYDILVSGLGITNYAYRIYVTDGTFSLAGNATGDLCGTYPGPSVCGIRGRPLPPASGLTEGAVNAFNFTQNRWDWRVPIYTIPSLGNDLSGPSLTNATVSGIFNRQIDNTSTPQIGNAILFNGTKWYYGNPSAPVLKGSMTFSLCLGLECQIGSNITNPFITTASTMTVDQCYISARIPPTLSNLIVDIKLNTTSIFGVTKLQLTPSGGVETLTPQATSSTTLDRFTVDIVQVGTGFKGQDVTVTCKTTLTN